MKNETWSVVALFGVGAHGWAACLLRGLHHPASGLDALVGHRAPPGAVGGGRTPLQGWQADPTPLRDVPAAGLWTFTLEDAGTRTLTTRGIRFKRRDYVGPWMTGQAGIQVRVRFMPHHDHRIEVYHAATGRYLGPADLADQATDEQISAVRRARAARAARPPGPSSDGVHERTAPFVRH